jgi:hypothetical protein
MRWNAIFTAIEGVAVSKWNVTLNNFPTTASDCKVVVDASNGGTASVVVVP